MNKTEKMRQITVDCAQSLLDALGEDTEFMIVVKNKTCHCTVCTNPMEIARSIMVNMADENSVNRDVVYNIIKATAASLLLCKDIDYHKDFEDVMSDCLMDSLSQ